MISWSRFYDPETGRYVSADSIGLAGRINLYGYVGGDPVNWIDQKGLIVGSVTAKNIRKSHGQDSARKSRSR